MKFITLLAGLIFSSVVYAQAPEIPAPTFPDIMISVSNPAPPVEYHPVEFSQVILRYDHEDGRRTVVEVKARVALVLVPLNEEHPAPLNKNDVLICRPYTPDGTHLNMRCGSDHYVVAVITFGEAKHE